MERMRSDIMLLPILHRLLAERSVSRTAAGLGVTQSAVSQALARARVVLRDELLIRQGHQMVPTPLALHLTERLGQWMTETESLLAPVQADPRQRQARIMIIANDFTELALLPPVLGAIAREAPGITLVMRSVEAIPINSPSFVEGRVHFAIAGIQQPAGPIVAMPLFNDHFVAIARHGHPCLAAPWTAEGYAAFQHALVSPQGQGSTGLIDDHLAMLGLSRRITLSLTRFTGLPGLLASSDLIATVPSRFAERPEVRAHCHVMQLPFPSPTFTMSLLWHRRYNHDPLHGWIRELFVAAAAGDPASPAVSSMA